MLLAYISAAESIGVFLTTFT